MKKAITVSVIAVSLLVAGPAQTALARETGTGITGRTAVNAQTTLTLQNAARLNIIPSPGLWADKPIAIPRALTVSTGYDPQKTPKTPQKPVKKQPVSRGDTFDAAKIIRIAVGLKGVPYKSRGQTPAGFDCSGFTRYVFKAGAGIELPHSSAEQARVGTAVAREDLRPGDLVYFNTSGSGISHVGIFIGGDNFISSTSSSGVQVTSLNDDYWGPRYKGARRVE